MNESNKPTTEETTPTDHLDIRVEVFGRTDVGLVREHNEDNFLVADLTEGNRSIRPEVRNHRLGPKGSIFAVCDGMGGAAAGEVASQIAVDTIYDMMQLGAAATNEEALAQNLEKAICEAGRRILTAAKLNRSQRGMGTTVTAATLIGPRLLIGQVGDSRAYILRGDRLVQVTKDQSLVQQLIDAKQMTEEEAKTFDKNNIILQALGTAEEVHVDITTVLLKKGDRLVMCSDGLSGVVDNDAIRDVLLEIPSAMEACRVLTERACQGGGHDNITAIVAVFDGESLASPPPNGAPDPELVYTRFTFSRSSETTARKMRPGKSPGRQETGETTQPVQSLQPATPTVRVSPPPQAEPPSSSGRLWVVAGLLAICVLIVTVVVAMGGNDAESSSPTTIPTPPPPKEPPRPVAPPPQPTAPSVPPVAAEPSPAPSAAPSTEEAAPEPELKPTPEEAITKSRAAEKMQEGVSHGNSSEGEDEDASRHHRHKKSASTISKENPYADESTDNAPTAEKNTEKEKLGEEVKDTAPPTPAEPKEEKKEEPKTDSTAPPPIADNPFAQ